MRWRISGIVEGEKKAVIDFSMGTDLIVSIEGGHHPLCFPIPEFTSMF